MTSVQDTEQGVPAALVAQGKSDRLIPVPGDTTRLNFSAPLADISGVNVPTPLFFVRSNNPPPTIDASEWSMTIGGLVGEAVELNLEQLQKLPTRTVGAWIECAGNSRTRFDPPAEGTSWDNGAVSSATWTGVSLVDVLALAGGATGGAVEIVATGWDKPDFQRSLPLAAALNPEVMLVWEMNGKPLIEPHGGPVRLLVPRWIGIANVKWLRSLEVVAEPFGGYWQAERYVRVDADGSDHGGLREMPVKSVIASPEAGARVSADGTTRVFGFAWSGHGEISSVDVSTDGGESWQPASLTASEGPLAWTRWEMEWAPAKAGDAELQARATDSRGNRQPTAAEWNKYGYQMNAIQSVVISVR